MRREDLLGVWRLLGITHGDGPVETSQTHLVVTDRELWEVWPGHTYYEGEPGPEAAYEVEEGSPLRLRVLQGRGAFCYLVVREGATLRMRLGSVFGHFPDGMSDEDGNLLRFERVEGAEAEKLTVPPPRTPRRVVAHPRLGALSYDDHLAWWTGKTEWGGAVVKLTFQPLEGESEAACFERIEATLPKLARDEVERYAASRLLALHNDSWREAEETEPLDEARFIARITPESIRFDDEGSAEIGFADGDLFWGHFILVDLDHELTPRDASIAG